MIKMHNEDEVITYAVDPDDCSAIERSLDNTGLRKDIRERRVTIYLKNGNSIWYDAVSGQAATLFVDQFLEYKMRKK
jgi:hypothetical protein